MPVILRKPQSHHLVFFVCIALVAVSSCLSTAFIISSQHRTAISEGLELSSYHARNFEEQLTRSLESVRRMSDFIAAGSLDTQGPGVNAFFIRLLHQTPFLRSLSTVDAPGPARRRRVCSSAPEHQGIAGWT